MSNLPVQSKKQEKVLSTSDWNHIQSLLQDPSKTDNNDEKAERLREMSEDLMKSWGHKEAVKIIDPLCQPGIIIFTHVVRKSTLEKMKTNFQVEVMFATGRILAYWLIDNTMSLFEKKKFLILLSKFLIVNGSTNWSSQEAGKIRAGQGGRKRNWDFGCPKVGRCDGLREKG